MFNTTAGSNHATGLAGLGVSNSAPPLPAGANAPARRLTDWTTALDAVAMSDPSKARALLEGIAQGKAQPDEAAQCVFSDLIAHDAHALFVEVFTAHNELQQARAQAEGKDFKSRLMLQLPSGWKTSAPAAMAQAFTRVRVDLLGVRRAPGSTAPASEAVCSAIAAMLKFGTSALWLQGALDEPLLVANAIAASEHLQVIALEDPQLGRPLDAHEGDSHHILIARGLTRCASLKRVGLHHPELVTSLQRTNNA